jgi:hypothetical protein
MTFKWPRHTSPKHTNLSLHCLLLKICSSLFIFQDICIWIRLVNMSCGMLAIPSLGRTPSR